MRDRLHLADRGKRVLLISTDPASNLDEMLGIALSDAPMLVSGATGLSALNINAEAATESYRERVLAELDPGTSGGAVHSPRAALRRMYHGDRLPRRSPHSTSSLGYSRATSSGSITSNSIRCSPGHTLRLLSLPKTWTGFLAGNDPADRSCAIWAGKRYLRARPEEYIDGRCR